MSRPLSLLTRYAHNVGIADGGAAETVVATTLPAQAQLGDITGGLQAGMVPIVIIHAILNITAGTAATAVVLRCRQGGISGVQVGNALTVTATAADSYQIMAEWGDSSNFLSREGGGSYVITVQETAATAAGTVNDISVEVYQ